MTNQYPQLNIPLEENESPGDYMERYLRHLSVRMNKQVTFSDVARHLGIPVNTVLGHKGGKRVESFSTMFAYATFFGPEILKAYGISMRDLAKLLSWEEEAQKARSRQDNGGANSFVSTHP